MGKNLGTIVSLLIATAVLSLTLFSAPANAQNAPRKIVVFQEWFVNEGAHEALLQRFGAVVVKALPIINAMAVYLPSPTGQALIKRAEVLRIDDDIIVEALAKPAPIQPAESLPWGVNRIGANLVWGATTGAAIKVAVLDTGIDTSHPDLKDNIKGGINTITAPTRYSDDNGHGTHVAGIIAALDNTIGVIGVGPGIALYAVKVLDSRGSGYISDVIEGLDWAIKNGMQVVNMSLGSSAGNLSFSAAINKVYAAGIVQVAAAGNNGPGDNTVSYPAKYPEVIAVSATDSNDDIAYFSSRGPEIDLAAPGVGIFSTYKGSSYKLMSGTSMAAPHVAGAAALVLTTSVVGTSYDADSDEKWDPSEVKAKLQDTAEHIGDSEPLLYGAGLVDVGMAISGVTKPILESSEQENAAPAAFTVSQNAPNPFNPATTIGFTIPQNGEVLAEVFNIAGQKVDTLLQTHLTAGTHSVTWNASRYSAGVYFCRVRFETTSKTVRMIFLK